ncbi:hypothetical protein [Streptomyces sp. NPDC088360]|uniref:hypothetical protein n=1 Tax=Streptomyces sp. NPDC088360 TaxID=3154515 RepID=UPI00344CCE03
MNEATAEQIIAAARESWRNSPEAEGGADAFDHYISVHGIEQRGPLFQETYVLANAEHPIRPGADEAALTACTERAEQLWRQVLPALEEYAEQCRTARYSGWSAESGGPVRRLP